MARLTHRETREVASEVVDDVVCDRCDKSILLDIRLTILGGRGRVSFGYGSEFDGDTWTFDICDECAGWLLGQIKMDDLGPAADEAVARNEPSAVEPGDQR